MTLAVVVSDTSPIRALAHLRQVELLRHLFGTVLVPPAVADELRSPPAGLPGVEVLAVDFVSVREPRNRGRVAALGRVLDPGEPQALAPAIELGIATVLMDEAAGRAEARRLGLRPVGVLGTLVRAKQDGLIEGVAPLMARPEGEIGFFISGPLRAEILRLAGEG